MVTITAELTIEELATELKIPKSYARSILFRKFGLNEWRRTPETFKFYIAKGANPGRRIVMNGEDAFTVGLFVGETDGSKAAVMDLLKRTAPSLIDMRQFENNVAQEPPAVTISTFDVDEEPEVEESDDSEDGLTDSNPTDDPTSTVEEPEKTDEEPVA